MKITGVKPQGRFKLQLQFEDGTSGIVDLGRLAGRGVFKAWEAEGVFEKVAITAVGALEWPGEIDLCPDSLYMEVTGKTAGEIFPALKKQPVHA